VVFWGLFFFVCFVLVFFAFTCKEAIDSRVKSGIESFHNWDFLTEAPKSGKSNVSLPAAKEGLEMLPNHQVRVTKDAGWLLA